jgi:hypothetical protein
MKKISLFTLCLSFFITLLAGCNLPQSEEVQPTMNVTQAFQTVEARLTQELAKTPLAPSPTPNLPTSSPLPPPTLQMTLAPTTSLAVPTNTSAAAPSSACDQASPGNPIDVTVQDNTVMSPGESFTKVWRLVNSGTCTWTREYRLVLFSGEAMGASNSISLPRDVEPGQSMDISVDMTAPQDAGTFQGNWKLMNAANNLFGIGPNGSSPFWVRIVVAGDVVPSATVTPGGPTITPIVPTVTPGGPTVAPSSTPTLAIPTLDIPTPPGFVVPTPAGFTPAPAMTSGKAPAVQVNGSAILLPAQKLDLDTNQIVQSAKADFSYEKNSAGKHLIIPQGTTVISVFGVGIPDYAACSAASMSARALIAEELGPGAIICYRTGKGLLGKAVIKGMNAQDAGLNLEVLTWSQQ